MSKFFIKGKYFVSEHIWFEDNIKENDKCDYLIVHGIPNPDNTVSSDNYVACKQETLISDLTETEEDLYSKLSKTYRYHVNRSEREGVFVKIWSSEEIMKSDYILNDFSIIYSNMYEEKGLKGQVLNINELKAYAQANALIITTASINDSIVVYHSYIKDKNNARLLHSCSEFRIFDNELRNAIGRANKYLHWNDLMYFKSIGIQEYDWGGISSLENPNGIDKFKLAFGGDGKAYYNIRRTCSLRAKMYKRIKRIIK